MGTILLREFTEGSLLISSSSNCPSSSESRARETSLISHLFFELNMKKEDPFGIGFEVFCVSTDGLLAPLLLLPTSPLSGSLCW